MNYKGENGKMNDKILDYKTYKNYMCWKYENGWIIENNLGENIKSFAECKRIINANVQF